MNLRQINEPVLFQGRGKTKNYFEGWYFKNVSSDFKKVISVIPGVSLNNDDRHAFIQTIINDVDSKSIKTHYHRFSIEEFKYFDNPFCLEIKNNTFSCDNITLELKDNDYSLKGKIDFSSLTKIKTNFLNPNIMGFFAYIPFMECYHGIVSMNHNLEGSLVLDSQTIDFNNGKGYIEKDWGVSFPKQYVWLQSNNFENPSASLMCSVADIPFLGGEFKGFICNLTVDNKEYRFATYNLSRLIKVDKNNDYLNITIKKDGLMLDINAKMLEGGILKAPKNGLMKNFIKEALDGVVTVILTKNSKEVLFEGTGSCCGIEIEI